MTREPAGSSLENEEATPPPPSAVATDFEAVAAKWLADEVDELRDATPRWRVSHLMILTAVSAVVLWLGMKLGLEASLLLMPLALIVMALTSAFVASRLRASRQEALVSMLAIAAERGMPLAPALEAFADQFRGRAQRRILGVVDELHAGKPLHLALVRPYRIVSRDASLMARVGDECGRLGPAMRLVGASRAQQTGVWSAVTGRLAYLLTVVSVAEGISAYLLYNYVPSFQAIFADFGVALPEVTQVMISGSMVLDRYRWVVGPLFLLQLILIIFLPFSFGGWLNYRVPVFDRLFGRRHTALTMRALSVVIEAGQPIGLGLKILAEQYPANWFRRRLAGFEGRAGGWRLDRCPVASRRDPTRRCRGPRLGGDGRQPGLGLPHPGRHRRAPAADQDADADPGDLPAGRPGDRRRRRGALPGLLRPAGATHSSANRRLI